ncbi:hypothetical protein WMY93_020202 [Mugilogobius chulae]|uniref:ribonuclease H n=1 Tax=Mugilogobius chulae TaxID=88201 RepID=A0AAW0NM87_9GOBI
MDAVDELSIKVSNAVLVEGTTLSSHDEEVIEFLSRYGKISRTETINDPDSEIDKTLVIEFDSASTIAALKPMLPYQYVSSKSAGTYCISELSTVYSDHVGKNKTDTYLADLENLAKVSGIDYAEVLSSMMKQISRSLTRLHLADANPATNPAETPEEQQALPAATSAAARHPASSEPTQHQPTSQSRGRPSLAHLPAQDLNPPEVQRLVVEHIVKSEDAPAHHLSAQRLRAFSGRTPRPSHEADYDTWRTGVDLLLTDPAVSDLHRSRRIVDSLLPPAADMIRHISPDSLPSVYLQILDSAYGTVQDGEELFAKFMDTFQNPGERPSAYLQRLQCALHLAVKRGGVLEKDMNKHLLSQFCRGCWDNTLISELQLKQKKGRTGTGEDQKCPSDKTVQCAEVSQSKSSVSRLPHGLVGSKCTALVQIAGRSCSCLLDTGSQVTTIPISFYNSTLSDQPVKPLDDLLHVEGAAGQTVPYLGYVEVPITFSKDFLGSEITVPTLALVVPNESPAPVLIGMNTLEPCMPSTFQSDCTTSQPTSQGYCAVLKLLALRHRYSQEGSVGVIRLSGRNHKLYLLVALLFWRVQLTLRSSLQHSMHSSSTRPLLCLVDCVSRVDVLIPPLTVIANMGEAASILTQQTTTAANSTVTPLQFNFGNSPIPAEWKDRIIHRLNQMPEVFSQNDLDFGCTDKVRHHIKLHDETPFKHRARPIHPHDIEAVRSHLRDLLEAGVIRESESPFSSPIVVVRKKNGDVRLCIDFRKLNLQTVKDAYALPNPEESFSALSGSKWFTVLDLKSGYYQIAMNEEDKPKTAFVTPIGFWEFNRMPQGVTNAPSTFQRLMERCMGDLHLKEVLVFLDDIIIFSDTLEEHERRLLQVLTRLRDYGLKLSPEKWFAGYYRRFIKDYASFTKPLNDLTKGYAPARKSAKGKKLSTTYLSAKEPFGERWTVDCQKAFEVLIDKLTSAPVLGFANPKLPYILHTDASTTGLGAALYQEQDGQLRVIAYASRGLSHSESRYPAHKLEFLALKWSVVEKFHDYLYGANFTVVTDSNPLTYVLTSARLDATSHRWLAALSAYSFKLQYRAGRHNHDADGLSRRPHSCPDDDLSQKEQGLIQQFLEQRVAKTEDEEELSPEIVNTICETSLQRRSSADVDHLQVTLAESLSLHAQAIPDCFSSEDLHGLPELPELSQTDLRDRQQADPAIREVVRQLETGESVAPILRKEFPELPLLLRELPKLEMRDGVLFRRRMEDGHANLQLVLPPDLRSSVLTSLHIIWATWVWRGRWT